MRSLDGFVASIKSALAEHPAGEHAVVRRKLRSVVHACGWKRSNAARSEILEQALAAENIFADPDITDPDLGSDTYVRFSLEPPQRLGQVFKPEKALAYHLSKYLNVLESALPDLGKLRLIHGGRNSERKFYKEGKVYKPDLVLSSSSGRKVAFELERGDPKHESVSQVVSYVGLFEGGIGVLVTAKPRTKALCRQIQASLDAHRAQGMDLRWLCYDVRVTVTPFE